MIGTVLSAPDHEVLVDFGRLFVARHESLLRGRAPAGRFRDGHGDLHAGNLCLVEERIAAADGAPALERGLYAFDCLEFSPELRANDVASEVAFLAMDLVVRGRPDLADAFVDAYVAASGDDELRVLLPFYADDKDCVVDGDDVGPCGFRGVSRLASAQPPRARKHRRPGAYQSDRESHFSIRRPASARARTSRTRTAAATCRRTTGRRARTSNGSKYAWNVYFLDGSVGRYLKTGDLHVRAVRGGQ